MERGSILILTLIAVMVLSMMITGLLTVGTTELYTTQNYQLNRVSHFHALQGLEVVRDKILNSEEPDKITLPGIATYENGVSKMLYLGSVVDLQEGKPYAIKWFEGFPPPPLRGMSLGSNSNIQPVIWEVQITAEITQGTRKTYSEIVSGVYTLMNL